MSEQKDVMQYDKRVMHRYVAEGKMKKEEVEQYLQELPDMTEECTDIAESIYSDLPQPAERKS